MIRVARSNVTETRRSWAPRINGIVMIRAHGNQRPLAKVRAANAAIEVRRDNNKMPIICSNFRLIIGSLVAQLGCASLIWGQYVDKPSHLPTTPDVNPALDAATLASDPLARQQEPNSTPAESRFDVEAKQDRLCISLDHQPVVDFVFRDETIRRPYFANARLANGVQITRHHPPIDGEDALDHDQMHPGIWLGLGDLNGHDFWRNKAAMEHLRFVTSPNSQEGRLQFATECRLRTNRGEPLCLLTNEFSLIARPNGWLLVWAATFRADQCAIVFGDQEEMGFAARVATRFTEQNGGTLRSSTGRTTAKDTWGQPAKWCDYSGSGPQSGGILLMASEKNFRESWWHNRDYGVFVANPFGRAAMQQGAHSAITVAQGETLKLTFGAMIHDDREFDTSAEYQIFQQQPAK